VVGRATKRMSISSGKGPSSRPAVGLDGWPPPRARFFCTLFPTKNRPRRVELILFLANLRGVVSEGAAPPRRDHVQLDRNFVT